MLMAEALVFMTGAVLFDNPLRSNPRRRAVWRQDEHWKIRRSIANGVLVSVRTSIRRISAPHAKHFIAAPRHPVPLNEALMVAKKFCQDCGGAVPLGLERA